MMGMTPHNTTMPWTRGDYFLDGVKIWLDEYELVVEQAYGAYDGHDCLELDCWLYSSSAL